MLYSFKNREDLEELASLQNQVKEVRLQDKLGKQKFHENTKKNLNQLPIQKNTSKNFTRTSTETSINNKQALESFNEKVFKINEWKGMIAPYLASSSVNLFTPENKSDFILIKDHNSTRMKNFLMNTSMQVTI